MFGGIVRLVLVAFPISSSQPSGLLAAGGAFCCAAALLLWLFGDRAPRVAIQALMTLAVVLVSGLISQATTGRGALLAAFAYFWIVVYTAHFFSRRWTLATAFLISVTFAWAMHANGLPGGVVDWLLVSFTVFVSGTVLGNLVDTLRRQADTDCLTGLLNRSGFLAAAARERSLADRTGCPLTLAVLDLDGFKQINDCDGHAAGDRLLAALARDWREQIRSEDILARHGGDEFVLVLPDTTPTGGEAVLERLRECSHEIGWSIGVSEWLPGESIDAPLARADRYLYGVKGALRAASEANGNSAPPNGALADEALANGQQPSSGESNVERRERDLVGVDSEGEAAEKDVEASRSSHYPARGELLPSV
jgi:diguanylate cyclase